MNTKNLEAIPGIPRTSSRSSWFEYSIESCRGERGLRRRKWRNLNTQRSKWEADRLATWWGCRSGVSVCGPAHSCPTLCDPIDCSLSGSSVHGIFPGKITGVGCHFLLQGIFLTQRSNPSLMHLLRWHVGSLPLCHLGSPGAESRALV